MPIFRRSSVDVAEAVHVLAVDEHLPAHLGRRHEVDRAVDALQQRGLAGVGRADDAEDLPPRDLQGDLAAAPASRRSRTVTLRNWMWMSIAGLPLLSRAEIAPQADRQAVDRQHQADQHHGRAVRDRLGNVVAPASSACTGASTGPCNCRPVRRERTTASRGRAPRMKNTAPVKRIGAVSPAARETAGSRR